MSIIDIFKKGNNIMAKPTRDEYNKALEDIKTLNHIIDQSKRQIDMLLDRLCAEKNALDTYKLSLQEANAVKDKFEIYEGIAHEQNRVNHTVHNKSYSHWTSENERNIKERKL